MDKSREQFEEWLRHLSNDELGWVCEDSALKAWQASRAALVAQLPRSPYFDISEIEVECALDKAGVKYEWIDK